MQTYWQEGVNFHCHQAISCSNLAVHKTKKRPDFDRSERESLFKELLMIYTLHKMQKSAQAPIKAWLAKPEPKLVADFAMFKVRTKPGLVLQPI